MDKTAIKNFAIWARRKLISDMKMRAGFMGITENGIAAPLPASTFEIQYFDVSSSEPVKIQGNEIQMRERIVTKLEQHAKESGYQTAYDSLIENMASIWFNRLIAIRYMEVNEYFPDQLRVLSSVSKGKQDPDIVSRPFDSDLEFTEAERRQINEWIDTNKQDTLFRFLLLKRCNQLAECLPGLFEEKNDESEFFLWLGFVEKDGLVYHLVHDIDEDAWTDQVQIIGWLYQYYNTEPKATVFGRKSGTKIKKEDVPAATQLFTPDWIVRYMVENSLGRLWIEGHPDETLKANWKYYLEEAEQEPEVQLQLNELREEYSRLRPEDLRCVDPCVGSGHILVYLFDVLMQIYESQGYTKREAAQSILQNNLYGLDIDDRAAQLAYFAVMMKARQYDRRILTRGIQPHVFAIQESNGFHLEQLKYFGGALNPLEKNNAITQAEGLIEALHDAKEYGSILSVENMDWDLLRRFADRLDEGQFEFDAIGIDETQKLLKELINVGEILSQKYDVTVTNPPYMAVSNASAKVQNYVKKHYPDSKADLFAVFIERCGEMTAKNRYQAMITQHAWMFLSSFEKLRNKLLQRDTVNMAHLGSRAFEEIGGEVVQTTSFVMRKSYIEKYKGTYCRLIEPNTQQGKEEMFLAGENRYSARQSSFSQIPGSPFAYWVSMRALDEFSGDKVGNHFNARVGLLTTDNDRFLRFFWEVSVENICFNANNDDAAKISGKKWFPHNKGGSFRKWAGNQDYVVDWENNGQRIKETAVAKYPYLNGNPSFVVHDDGYYFHENISWSEIALSKLAFRYFPTGFTFNVKGMSAFPIGNSDLMQIIAYANSKVANYFAKIINPSISFGVNSFNNLPYRQGNKDISFIAKDNIQLSQDDWDCFETSWNFKQHPLIYYSKGLWDATAIAATISYFYGEHVKVNSPLELCYMLWQAECQERFDKLKANEEKLNRIFIDIYGLQDELTPEVEDKDVTVRKADLGRDIRSFLSYAVGCMFGRYSLDTDGLAYAGGAWDVSKYTTFIPDEDNVIPITDQKYLPDDIVERLCEFLDAVYGKEKREENLDFIANALGGKGTTSREVIRKYFLNDFFKDHCKIYQKRPIYWLFDSGKQNGFKALVYMHRWDKNSIGRVLVYLHKIQEKYEIEVRAIDALIEHMTDKRQEAVEERRKDHLLKQIAEIKEYDESLEHMTNEFIDIDLDDGVKVNYEKVQTDRNGVRYKILAPIK